MKRISIVTLAAALVLLSGCNKDINNSVDIDLDNANDMLQIKLGGTSGATSATTRASIESLDEMTGSMGVFCLAGRKTNVKSAAAAPAPNWGVEVSANLEEYGRTTNGRYWSNVKCEVKPEGSIYRITPTADQTCYRYYPTTSLYGYDFYGYYPYQKNTCKYDADSKSIYVDMDITGAEDVIYGQSETIDDRYVDSLEATLTDAVKSKLATDWKETIKQSHYSARFFRKHPTLADDARMKLEHKLARFCFFVYPGPDKDYADTPSYEGATKLCIQEVGIRQVETELRLVIADQDNPERGGTLSARSTAKKDLMLRYKEGGLLSDAPVDVKTQEVGGEIIPDTTRLGDCIMVLPGKSTHYMTVTLADKDGNVYPSETDVAISFKNAGDKKFEAGKTYNVYLQVSGIKEIGITAELVDWEESGEEMDLIEFN